MVRELGVALRSAEIEVILDQFFDEENPGGPDEQWGQWSINQVKESDRVLMIGSGGWFRCFEKKEESGTGLGAAAETHVIQAEMYQSGYVTSKHRLVFLDEHVETSDVPVEIRTMKKFRPNRGSQELEALIGWLKSESKAETEAEEIGITWPEPIAGFQLGFANRRAEWPLVERLVTSSGPTRALFVEAPSFHGKSLFLREALRYCKELGLRTLYADFKNESISSQSDLLQEIGLRFGDTFPEFKAGGCKDPYKLRHELRQQTEPLVMIFDTWEKLEKRSKEIVDWFANQLIPELDQCPSVALIVGGQTIPKPEDYDAGHCQEICLGPIDNEDRWKEWVPIHYPVAANGFDTGAVDLPTLIAASGGGVPGTMCSLLAGIEKSLGGRAVS